MDLTAPHSAPPVSAFDRALTGLNNGEIPDAATAALFRRAQGEEVLWRGKPEVFRHAASALHTNSMAIYFAILSVMAFFMGGFGHALTVAVLGALGFAILFAIGAYSARHSAYVLTNHRLLILTGIIVDKRISIPLKRIASAKLRERSKGYGDIALELSVKSGLSYLLLWPHSRFLALSSPKPLLRAVPDAVGVAKTLADACAQYAPIERNLTDVKEDDGQASREELKGATA